MYLPKSPMNLPLKPIIKFPANNKKYPQKSRKTKTSRTRSNNNKPQQFRDKMRAPKKIVLKKKKNIPA
jgi:hypothetical protein